MKKSILVLAACTLLAGAMMTGCNTSAKNVENAQDNVVKANKELEQANKEYIADMANYRTETAARIAENDRTIAEFKAGIEHQKRAARAGYNKKIALLEQKNAEMKMKMENYKEEGKDKWQVFKAEFSHDMDELGKAFKDLTVKNVK
ncbi:MAG: peptidase M23 [Bacteroidota bacterium]